MFSLQKFAVTLSFIDTQAGEEKAATTKDDSGYLEENEDPQVNYISWRTKRLVSLITSGKTFSQVTASHSYGSGGWLGTLSIFGKTPNKKKDAASSNNNNGLFGKIKSSWW